MCRLPGAFYFVVMFLGVAVFASAANALTMVVLGDSLSEGYGVAREAAYPALLEAKLKEKDSHAKVINSSISGSTTASALARWKWVRGEKPEIVLLALGSNDGLRGMKPAEIEKHLSQVIEAIQSDKSGKTKIMLAGLMMPPNYGEKYFREFKAIYPRLAKKYKITLVPFILKDVAGHAELNLADGMHPNEKGHRLIFETVWKSLQGVL